MVNPHRWIPVVLIAFALVGTAAEPPEPARTAAAVEEHYDRPIRPSDLGILSRTVEIDVPAGMKVARLIRVYHRGEFDRSRSSVQIHADAKAWKERLSLSLFDPDALNPKPSKSLKVFGCAGTFWFTVRSKRPLIQRIGGEHPKSIEAGRDVPLFDLAVGPPGVAVSSLGGEIDPEDADLRITVAVRLDPITPEEERTLAKHGNFSKAEAVEP